jgi:uncharacterized membrane protein YeaQ/YmgE (transglycosylase-associated protein family)
MEFLGYLLVGVIVGPLARLLIPGDDPMPWWMTILVGAVGALIGGWLAQYITPDNNGVPLIASILGAAILVAALRLVRGGSTRRA